jgi:hypothetical protein
VIPPLNSITSDPVWRKRVVASYYSTSPIDGTSRPVVCVISIRRWISILVTYYERLSFIMTTTRGQFGQNYRCFNVTKVSRYCSGHFSLTMKISKPTLGGNNSQRLSRKQIAPNNFSTSSAVKDKTMAAGPGRTACRGRYPLVLLGLQEMLVRQDFVTHRDESGIETKNAAAAVVVVVVL